MKTPVALFFYRRPSLVAGLIKSLQIHRPEKLWLVADGPKDDVPSEKAVCREARTVAENSISWPCEIHRVYASTNLGLNKRIESGLDELFTHEREAIILEEDCHPTPEFLPFCQEMLARYRGENRIGGVSGSCFLPQTVPVATDYFFSRYLHIWGWATWARAWKDYDRKSWFWPQHGFREFFPRAKGREARYWDRVFQMVVSGRMTTWDYPWVSWFWKRGWVGITPSQNLIHNHGFGPGGTNTRDSTVETGVEREGFLRPPYLGPEVVAPDERLDRQVFQNHYLRIQGRLGFFSRIRRSLRKRVAAWGQS